MKRYKAYITISILCLMFPTVSKACWTGWYDASEYFMFRVCDTGVQDVSGILKSTPQVYRNCKEWQSLTSDTNDAFWYINRGKTGAVFESIDSNARQAIGNKN